MKFGLQRLFIRVNIQKKFQVPRSHSIGEKCDANFKLSSHFSRKVCDRGTWNLVCKQYRYGLIYKKNFKFLGCSVLEKNAMLTCKISKLFIRTIVQLWIFATYHRIFSRKVCDRGRWNLFCKEYPYGLRYKKNFKFLCRTVSKKSAMLISSYRRIFSQKVCDRGTWNLVCKEYPYGLIYTKTLKFLGRTVSEKNAMLTCKISKLFIRTSVQVWIFASYHRIFLEKCETEEHKIWFVKSIHMG